MFEEMFRELWAGVPTFFKVLWIVSIAVGLSVLGLVLWGGWELIQLISNHNDATQMISF